MNTKEYLSQAFRIDQRINSKLEQVASLRGLAIKAVSTLSDTPRSASPNIQPMETIIAKMVDLEAEISGDIDKLVDLKKKITDVIKSISNPEFQIILEKRYLCFLSWEQISVDMNYSMQYTFRMHGRALEEVAASLKVESKVD